MTYLLQEEFGGLAPKIDGRKLAPSMALIAENCLFENKNLRPLRYPSSKGVSLATNTKTVYPYLGAWLQFSERVSVAPGPIANDTYDRIYYTDSLYPKVKSGAGEWRLGIPRPASGPTIDPLAEPIVEDADNLLDVETVYYVVTLIDAFGAEGPPSVPSLGMTRLRNQELTVNMPSTPTGAYNFGPGSKWRVYRSNTGTGDTAFQFVTDLDLATPSFNDTVKNDELQEILPSATWLGPPDDNSGLWPDGPLQGITLGPNGVMAGFANKTIYFSEPYLPHAWPVEYQISIKHKILGIVWLAGGLLVVTKGMPVIIAGSHPASMTQFIPERGYPCNSADSLVDMGGWAMYSSLDGLVAVDGTKFTLVTEELITNNQWQNIVPGNSLAGNSEGRYVLFWETTDQLLRGTLIFDPGEGVNAMTTSTLHSDVAYTDPSTSRLLVRDDNDDLATWDWGANMTATWKSKSHVLSQETNFAYLELVANEYPVNVTLYAGMNSYNAGLTTVFNASVTGRYTALPSGFEYDTWEIKVSDNKDVVKVGLYEDMAEVG